MNNHAHIIAPLGDMTSSFLVNWFNAFDWMPYVSGTTRLKLTQGQMREAGFRVPPLNEQKRIVAKLDALQARADAAKQALDAIPPLLEKFRRSVLAAAFRGDLTREWRARNPDVEPASELLARVRVERRRRWEDANPKKKYVEPAPVDTSELPELPEGWCWATIETVGHLLLGRRRAASEYVDGEAGRSLRPYLRVANVKRDRLSLESVYSMPFDDKELLLYRLQQGDIIISEGQSPELVGQSAIFEGGYPDMCIQATVHRFRAYDSATTSGYAQLVFLHHLLTGVFRRASAQTTNIAHLTLERLKPLPFPLAPRSEQAEIIRVTRAMLNKADTMHRISQRGIDLANASTKSILTKAFRGELVPQDPNDEPAEVLLERIRAERAASEGGGKKRRGRARS